MALSQDLITQFAKLVNGDKRETKQPTLTYGWASKSDDGKYIVKLDGAPDTSVGITAEIAQTASGVHIDSSKDTRVVVLISNHSATIIASLESGGGIGNGDKKTTTLTHALEESARVKDLEADSVTVNNTLTAVLATINYLTATKISTESLAALEAAVKKLEAGTITTDDITATRAAIDNLKTLDLTVKQLNADYGEFKEIATEKLEASDAFIKNVNLSFANIDFSNIGKAAIEQFMATSGLIENVVVGDGTITGNLVGVTIKGDLIEANTLVADKLVIQGEDGLYYKLNTNGGTVDGEQTDYNSLNGSIITAKSITATQISVDDLVAFDATIGGFNITEDSIYSEVKDSEGNTTRGIYMDTDGQFNFGDSSNFIKYYRDEDGTYKLAISAASILYALNGKQYSVADLGHIGEYVHVGTYEDEPCIELGESDSDFKLVITNTRILFMEGSTVPAYITNQSLHITKAVIEEEIQQGEFVWKVRPNGNMGLVWKGGV